jgi:ATP-dependent exoDNAse (exonuclease V) beta subunit
METSGISVTRSGVWDTCKLQWKYRYFLKLESPEPEPFYFIFGKLMHKIAEEYVIQKGSVPLLEIKKAVLNGDILLEHDQKAPKIPQAYQKRMPAMIRSIQTISDKIGFDGEVEKSFQVDLDLPRNIIYRGVIDRLIINDNKCVFVDYKTTKKGRWRKNNFTVRKDLQLRSYAWAINKIYNIPPENIYGSLYGKNI